MYAGPTVLEVFNTLLRQLRLSVDYELTGSYDGNTNIGTKIIKAHEERQLQEAVIRTIGEFWGGVSEFLWGGDDQFVCSADVYHTCVSIYATFCFVSIITNVRQ